MKNLDQVLLDTDGKPLQYTPGKSWTLGRIITEVLKSVKIDQYRAYDLAMVIGSNSEVKLNQSDCSFIKEALKNSGEIAILVGQALSILEAQKQTQDGEANE